MPTSSVVVVHHCTHQDCHHLCLSACLCMSSFKCHRNYSFSLYDKGDCFDNSMLACLLARLVHRNSFWCSIGQARCYDGVPCRDHRCIFVRIMLCLTVANVPSKNCLPMSVSVIVVVAVVVVVFDFVRLDALPASFSNKQMKR